ncbi:MAG TPA: hypothetical protein VLJ58_07025 [Ramlibacter sp.]|nr:hypothetical protein [Ramlibacter sp.]
MQNEQSQARAGISVGSAGHSMSNAMLPQWQLPWMCMELWLSVAQHARQIGAGLAFQSREEEFGHWAFIA